MEEEKSAALEASVQELQRKVRRLEQISIWVCVALLIGTVVVIFCFGRLSIIIDAIVSFQNSVISFNERILSVNEQVSVFIDVLNDFLPRINDLLEQLKLF